MVGWEPATHESPYQYMSLNEPPRFLPYYNVRGDMLWNKIGNVVNDEDDDNGNNGAEVFLPHVFLLIASFVHCFGLL